MGAAREGFDLLNKWGRRNFWRYLRHGRFQRYMWVDTFGRVLCWLVGEHAIKQEWDNPSDPPETSCMRCCQWLKQDGYRWVEK